ncbi:MAG TPA: type IV toxin-antitoxin system AbiEi family antitoxin domain-containing protein, partial [Polyangiaceae bacterium]|nr:type IV toxin-antitoxin system AbiEi family antitoxin domain-containing protein [Polyangiaceae bacterium]
MNALEAIARLRKLRIPVFETSEAAAVLGLSTSATTKALSRLADAGIISSIRHGVWWLDGPIDPFRLCGYLTAPMPCYLSLQTALHLRGMIEQIPESHFAVSLARTQDLVTTVGTFSIHHIDPALFGGFDESSEGVWLATSEKALFDVAYLSGGRSRMFTNLPELELPDRFRWAELRRWIDKTPSAQRRTLVVRWLERLLAKKGRATNLPRW